MTFLGWASGLPTALNTKTAAAPCDLIARWK